MVIFNYIYLQFTFRFRYSSNKSECNDGHNHQYLCNILILLLFYYFIYHGCVHSIHFQIKTRLNGHSSELYYLFSSFFNGSSISSIAGIPISNFVTIGLSPTPSIYHYHHNLYQLHQQHHQEVWVSPNLDWVPSH